MDNGKQVKNDNYAADIASIREARVRIAPYIHETPVLTSKSLDSIASKRLYFKCECFQKGGAFKIRGASNAIFSLSDDQAAKGVLTHSSGNHAAAVALAAKLRGIPAYVVIPKNAPKCKVENVRRYGGQIFWSESTIQSRESITEKVQQDTGAILVHPFNNRFTISPFHSTPVRCVDAEDVGIYHSGTTKICYFDNEDLLAFLWELSWFIKRQKRTLFEVLEKVKAELMILGFISLLLTFSQDQIAKICVPKAVADSMLPCRPDAESTGRNKRRLLALVLTESHLKRRILAAGDSVVECPPEKEQLITATGLHQLHILIFFLAEFHVVNSALIMVLGRAKIHRWKDWETDTTSAEYAFTTEPVYRDAKGKAISKEELLKPKEEEKPKILIASIEFTNLKYSRVEIDDVRFEWAECMLDYI
ncbi:hypothetical protein ZIOFF_028396 [Zingiber officinale]|uniref:MLO-like protein n=1 Tax=Zingiber officinale TaxID=94328 RepID=A0A8J5L9V5_ZINOF|nr:hypothetical protein ZIOFF_028396 [Zingiber officinale]